MVNVKTFFKVWFYNAIHTIILLLMPASHCLFSPCLASVLLNVCHAAKWMSMLMHDCIIEMYRSPLAIWKLDITVTIKMPMKVFLTHLVSNASFCYMKLKQLITYLLQEIAFAIFSLYLPVFAYRNWTEKILFINVVQ